MGEVKNILRLGDFHGLDDAFCLARYQCEFWAESGQESYKQPKPTVVITSTTESPFPNSEFLFLKRPGILLACVNEQFEHYFTKSKRFEVRP